MKQVLEDLRDGSISVEDVPPPQLRDEFVLVRNRYSLISSGTEGGTVKLGRMGLLAKARARPEQAMKVLQLARAQGLLTAYAVAMRALETPLVLGYSCAGEVMAVGKGVDHVRMGDVVACAGQGYANHAEIVIVPKRLCVPVPVGLDPDKAAFATVGAIALQSLREADVRLGDNVVVIGLGLVGLLVAQLLRAAGCRVFGLDIDAARLAMAHKNEWAETCPVDAANVKERVLAWSDGAGADVVIVTAATEDASPVALAGDLCRTKGRVVVVGRTEMQLPREHYLFKELELRTSMAYGPGTGDPNYEQEGHDYPLPYVRWTEQRNMSAFLDQVSRGRIDLATMITHRFPLDQAADAFALISGERNDPSLGILLEYPNAVSVANRVNLKISVAEPGTVPAKLRVAVLGAGSHATNEFLPALAHRDVEFRGIASATGVRAVALGKKYGFAFASADVAEVLSDAQTDAVFILTRHDSHADLTAQALAAGKQVFVEKPLALDVNQLHRVVCSFVNDTQALMVGFNRRFAPLAIKLREMFMSRAQPISVVYRANVGYRPPQHWLHHPREGGGVILGEACHHVDFCLWLIGSSVTTVDVRCLGGSSAGYLREDNVHVTLGFADGSLATLMYLSNGSKVFPTEAIEVSCENRSARLLDFKRLESGHGLHRRTRRLWRGSAKGIDQQIASFLATARNSQGFDRASYIESSRLIIEIDRLLKQQLAGSAKLISAPSPA
jgi:predicted dehydrogenase/threonine dehydrogenase-like Zn-dependent dehydrogenase